MRTLKHGVRTHEFDGTKYDSFRTTGSGRKVHLFTKVYTDQKDAKSGKVVATAAAQQETDIAKLLSNGAEEVKPT